MSSVSLTVCNLPETGAGTQEEILRYLADACSGGREEVGDLLAEAAIAREESVSTLLENGLAVPHARTGVLNKIAVAAAFVPHGIAWPEEANRAELVLFLGVPSALVTEYLALIRHLILWYKHLPAGAKQSLLGNAARLREELQHVIDR